MSTFTFKHKLGFTMLELVMVIVVLGILAALALPRMERDHKQEAADHILSQIRYTQHLALNDDVHNNTNPQWQRAFWQIGFGTCAGNSGLYEYIGSDKNYGGGINNNEAAIDPTNNKIMIWTGADCSNGGDGTSSENIFLTKKYGVTAIDTTACNNRAHIGFDHLGRPHQSFGASNTPDYASYLSAVCTLKFTLSSGETFRISIQPETGYAQIVGQNDS